ncbi:hypothetical protein BJY04DRAFT_212807 [Aspergillus karnatakaensis]|uniref:uncharacterized protein n=1 Tax=Aspergillus karnatakaensis TaxID=1810916 RepID=UPI003CCC9F23
MNPNKCHSGATFNEISSNAITPAEWPANLPGLICKTPPMGPNSSSRFAQCCSGPVYNITEPTTPDHPAYPISCAAVCQIDPALDDQRANYDNPYGWTDHFMCITDGGRLTDQGEIVCDSVTVPGKPAPTEFASTPTWADWHEYWTSTVYSDGAWPVTHWYEIADAAYAKPSDADSETPTTTSTVGADGTTTQIVDFGPSETKGGLSSVSAEDSPTTTGSAEASSPLDTTPATATPADPTLTSSGSALQVRLTTALAVASLLCAMLQ